MKNIVTKSRYQNFTKYKKKVGVHSMKGPNDQVKVSIGSSDPSNHMLDCPRVTVLI